MSPSNPEIQDVLGRLETTPEYLRAAVSRVNESALYRKPDAETWSANEILAHLRACADVWGRSLQRMLDEDNPKARYISPRGYMKKTGYEALAFTDSFEAFQEQRAELLATLRTLSPDAWLRPGTFTGTTLGKHQTVYSYAKRIADHEHHHFPQIDRVLRDVGPEM